MSKKKGKLISFIDYACQKGAFEDNPHCDRIMVENEYEPQDYIVQRHLTNMVATYGREFVVEVIGNMGLDKSNIKKVG